MAPADVNQNIGIHYSFGQNQTISGNEIIFPGTGISDPSGDLATNRAPFSNNIGIQSNTSGGNAYDNLLISNNTFRVTGAQDATNPARIIGLFENGHAHSSDITISNNQFINDSLSNNPLTNLQQAFWITSHSSLTSAVAYSGNSVAGASIGFKWLGSPEFPQTPPAFSVNQPINFSNNTATAVKTGFLVQSNGLATFTNNSVTGGSGIGFDIVSGTVTINGGSLQNLDIGIRTAGSGSISNVNFNAGTDNDTDIQLLPTAGA